MRKHCKLYCVMTSAWYKVPKNRPQGCPSQASRPDVQLADFKEQDTVAPTYDVKQFGLTAPIENKFLARKQSAIDEWTSKFSRLADGFNKLLAEHNKTWNPSGTPYKGELKRTSVLETEDDRDRDPATWSEVYTLRVHVPE